MTEETQKCQFVPIPSLCSEMSLLRKEELEELLPREVLEWRDVLLVSDDFFAVFCVAVRLHSVKKKTHMMKVNVIVN